MSAVANRTDYLTIGAVIIGTAACHATNLQVLYDEQHRGQDRLVPGSAGVIATPRRLDSVTHILQLVINGRFASSGSAHADPYAGVRTNIAELKTITAPVTTGDGTRSVSWTRGGSTVTADCHVGPLLLGQHSGPILFATLDLTVPDGAFT